MVLWLLFLERMGYADPVHITVGDIIDKCKIYQINIKPVDFKDSYRIFKKFSLIDYSDDINNRGRKSTLVSIITVLYGYWTIETSYGGICPRWRRHRG